MSDIPQNLQNSLSPTGGLNNPAEAARALEFVTGSDPSALGYYQLAVFATVSSVSAPTPRTTRPT